jgi:Holliday junction DNA helicase RuvB
VSESLLENPDYDLKWDDYIGQPLVKRQLQIAATSARSRGVTMPHTLLEGTSGNGKTTLAVLAAREMQKQIKVVAGPVRANEARQILLSMEDGDILLWDEFGDAVVGGKAKLSWALNFLQDGVIVTAAGEEEMPKVCIIACTNEVGKLPDTILTRFQLRPVLVDYTHDEATLIAKGMTSRLFGALPLPNDETLGLVATAADNNPRLAKQILANIRDLAICSNNAPKDGSYSISETLELMNLTCDGLDKMARDYLTTLLRFPDGLGRSAVAEVLNAPGGVDAVERVLVKRGYILKLKAGRRLSGSGVRRANDLLRAEKEEAIKLAAGHSLIA